MSFTIEKSLPPPPVLGEKYPFRKMQVGDSVFIADSIANVSAVRAAACAPSIRKAGLRFSVKAEQGGCRVWRIAKKGKAS